MQMFTSVHYTGKDLNTEYRNGEPWKKVFGPIFVYLNSISGKNSYQALWANAKKQVCLVYAWVFFFFWINLDGIYQLTLDIYD